MQRGEFVLVEAAESIAPSDTALVIMQSPVEVCARDDQNPVEALAADTAHAALGVCLRTRRRDRRADHPDPFRAEPDQLAVDPLASLSRQHLVERRRQARSADRRRGRPTWRRNTSSSCRSTRISTSFARSERPKRTRSSKRRRTTEPERYSVKGFHSAALATEPLPHRFQLHDRVSGQDPIASVRRHSLNHPN
jgi:hypothetical protein